MTLVTTDKLRALEVKMASLGIREEDLSEHFVRASGSGGQKVNKTTSCVVLKHHPSGIEVKCQESRSQAANRFFARRRLVEKLEEKRLGEKSETQQKLEKVRRQKRRRSRRAKQKILADKGHRATIKTLRKVGAKDLE